MGRIDLNALKAQKQRKAKVSPSEAEESPATQTAEAASTRQPSASPADIHPLLSPTAQEKVQLVAFTHRVDSRLVERFEKLQARMKLQGVSIQAQKLAAIALEEFLEKYEQLYE